MGDNFTFSAGDIQGRCIQEALAKHVGKPGVLYCPPFHDTLNCLHFTEANTTLILPCPRQLNAPSHIVGFRTCGADGSWLDNRTNYDACLEYLIALQKNQTINQSSTVAPSDDGFDRNLAVIMRDIYFVTSILSLVLLVITLFIFCYFRSLHCNRISIHKHLVVSFIIRFIVMIVVLEPVVFSHVAQSYLAVEWLCKIMKTIEKYTVLTNMYWMLVEGIFLHNSLVFRVFSTEAPFKVFVFTGWIVPVFPAIAWYIVKYFTNSSFCWHEKTDLDDKLVWIILGPFLLALAANLIFLVSIIRVLVAKLRAKNTHESSRIKKAIRATIILLPLLGLTNLFFLINPEDRASGEIIYRLSNSIFQGLQGILISVFYCFLNGEVKRVLRRKYRRFKIKHHLKNSGRRRSSWTSSFVMSQTETHPSSSSDSNNANHLHQVNNNKYSKADLIIEVRNDKDLPNNVSEGHESIKAGEGELCNSHETHQVLKRKESSKLNNVHFAMEGDKVKCETFPSKQSCADQPATPLIVIEDQNYTRKNNESQVTNSLECSKSTKDEEHFYDCSLDKETSRDHVEAPSGLDSRCVNRFSVLSFGDMPPIVDGFANDVSEEITRLLDR